MPFPPAVGAAPPEVSIAARPTAAQLGRGDDGFEVLDDRIQRIFYRIP